MNGFLVALLVPGLGALLLTFVCGAIYLFRRQSHFLHWALSWAFLTVWYFGHAFFFYLPWRGEAPLGLKLGMIAVLVGFVFWWLRGLWQFYRHMTLPLFPSTRIPSAWPLAAASIVGLVGLTFAARLLWSERWYTLSQTVVVVGVLGASAVVFAIIGRRVRRVGPWLLAVCVGLLAVQAGHDEVALLSVASGDSLAEYLASISFLDFFLMGLLAMGFVIVLLDDDQMTLKKALEQLRESEDRFRLMFEHGGVGMALLGRGGNILESNPALQRMLGYTGKELHGRPLAEFLHPEEVSGDTVRKSQIQPSATPQPQAASSPVIRLGLLQDSSTELYEREKRYRHQTGRTVWARVLRVPVRDMQGNLHYHVGVLVDITERRQAELALAASEERYRLLFQASLDGMLVLTDEGVILDANPSLCTMLGWHRSELLNRPLADFADDAHSMKRRLRSVLVQGGERFETLLRRQNGATIDAEVSGAVVPAGGGRPNLHVSCRDVSERKRSEEALKQSELERRWAEQNLREERDFISTVLDTAEALIVVLDPKGRIVRFNGQCARLSGFTEEEVRGRPFSWVIWGDGPPLDDSALIPAQPWPLPAEGGPVAWRMRNGEERWIVWRTTTVQTGQGELGYVIGAGLDVTEQRLLEEQLRHAQRMEMLGTLVGGIAHDFNNHLTAILGNLQLVLGGGEITPRWRIDHLDLDPELVTLLSDAERATQRCVDMTSRLLTFSRSRGALKGDLGGAAGSSQPSMRDRLDINDLVVEGLRLLQRVLPSTLQVRTRLQTDAWLVRGDGTGLHQVLMNLAVNARDAMPRGGQLTITTANRALTDEACNHKIDAHPGVYLELTVQDTGQGMAPEVLKRIFDPFFTTKGAGHGTGLGLAVVYGIVKAHGGWIEVVSEPGSGSQFKVFLPADRQTAEEKLPAGPLAEPLRPLAETDKGPRSAAPAGVVLVVDDEELIRNLARSVLERGGFRVLLAEDGEQALQTFRRHRGEIAVVLLDYTMPRMTGLQVMEALLKIDSGVRVVFSTGYAGDRDSESLISSGAAGFVPKPYRPQELLQAVRQAAAPLDVGH